MLSPQVKRRGNMRRGESVESNVDMVDSPRGRSGYILWTQKYLGIKLKISRSGVRNAGASASSQKRALYRKAVSMGDGMATDQSSIWQSKESVGSNESLASNASIPLPVPVRTRSARGGSESGYSSDTYNAMTIRSPMLMLAILHAWIREAFKNPNYGKIPLRGRGGTPLFR